MWTYKYTYQGVLYQHSFGVTLILASLVTTSIIMVISGNLILSLGMVGALSIVRFRTPIKEPEELAYLFLAIAIGLGYAAMENLGYLASGNLADAWTLKMVKVRYIPLVMHLGFGVIMGWLLSLNLFEAL